MPGQARRLDHPDEAIAVAGHGLDIERVLGFISQGFAQSPYRDIQAGLKFDEGVFRPELRFQLFTCYQFPWAIQQSAQHQK